MSTTFNLTNSAIEVNTALQAVVGADTTPDAASVNMVTSQGVFNHVNTELGPFKGKTLTTEGTGITATDNDTSVPTSAAVKDYVDNDSSLKFATYTDAAGSFPNDGVLPLTEDTDASNLGTVSNGTITLGSGVYLIAFSGTFDEADGDQSDYFLVKLRHNGTVIAVEKVNDSRKLHCSFSRIISSGSSQTIDVFIEEEPDTSVAYENAALSIIKIG
jgi:hypothetical protein